jgi:uncharacterized repeat protein (TIGR01451 family)
MLKPEVVLFQEGNRVEKIKTGVVRAGEVLEFEIEVQNIGNTPIYELVFLIDHPDAKVVSGPSSLVVGEKGLVKIVYKPDVQLDAGLDVDFVVKGRYVV